MINLILFGPPGSGKGTQAAKLVEKYALLHISTGDLFRREIKNQSELGRLASSYTAQGHLVPDSVTIGILKAEMEAHPEAKGVIFDGFPRTVPQAEALDALLADNGHAVTTLLALQVPDAEITARILKRGESSGRADDQDPAIIQNRIAVYKAETQAVYDYYAAKGKAESLDGVGEIDAIFSQLCAAIEAHA